VRHVYGTVMCGVRTSVQNATRTSACDIRSAVCVWYSEKLHSEAHSKPYAGLIPALGDSIVANLALFVWRRPWIWDIFATRRLISRVSIPRWPPHEQGTKVSRYNRHSAGSLRWPFPKWLKYEYIYQVKYTHGSNFISNSTRKLLLFDITKMLIAV